MKKGRLFFAAVVSLILISGASTSALGQGRQQFAIYVKGGGAPVNIALGKPIELAFTASGKFATDNSKDFSANVARHGRSPSNEQIVEAGRETGLRFICLIDASGIKIRGIPPNLSGAASISILDVASGNVIGAPLSVGVPPSNIADIGKQLLEIAVGLLAVDVANRVGGAINNTGTSEGAAVYVAPTEGSGAIQVAQTAQTVQAAPQIQREKPRLSIRSITGGSGEDGETIITLLSIQDGLRSAFNIASGADADYTLTGSIGSFGRRKLLITVVVDNKNHGLVAGSYHLYENIEEIPNVIPDIVENIAAAGTRAGLRLTTISIAPFVGQESDTEELKALAQLFPVAIGNTGMYVTLPSRVPAVRAALDSMETENPNINIEDKAKAVAEITDAEHILFAETRRLGNMNMLVMRIINAADGSQIAGESLNYQTIGDIVEQLPKIAEQLTANTPKPTMIEYSLITNANPPIGGTVTRDYNQPGYNAGAKITMTADPSEGYRFIGWSGASSSKTSPVTITMDEDKMLTANFTPLQYKLTTAAERGGIVTRDPDRSIYDHGTKVTVTAVPDTGYGFTRWAGASRSSFSSITVTMNSEDMALTANFRPLMTPAEKRKLGLQLSSAGLATFGFFGGVVTNGNVKSAHDRYNAARHPDEARRARNNTERYVTTRNVYYFLSLVGVAGFTTVTIYF